MHACHCSMHMYQHSLLGLPVCPHLQELVPALQHILLHLLLDLALGLADLQVEGWRGGAAFSGRNKSCCFTLGVGAVFSPIFVPHPHPHLHPHKPAHANTNPHTCAFSRFCASEMASCRCCCSTTSSSVSALMRPVARLVYSWPCMTWGAGHG